jgi:integrase/recombinase XerD
LIQQFHKWHRTSSVKTARGWLKITTLKSQVLGANFSQLKKLRMQNPFGQTAAALKQLNSARSTEPSSQSYSAAKKLLVGLLNTSWRNSHELSTGTHAKTTSNPHFMRFLRNALISLTRSCFGFQVVQTISKKTNCSSVFITFRSTEMKQAKTLTAAELRRVTDSIATRAHAARNRAMLMMTHLAGLRVGEVAQLTWTDVINTEGRVREEVRLNADQTKGRHPRTVYLPKKLQDEIRDYVRCRCVNSVEEPLFFTATGKPFSANTLCQLFYWMYKRAGIAGGSSHSGRRTFITNLAARGVGVRVLMSLAGHRNIGTTQAYIDVNDDMKRRAVELV